MSVTVKGDAELRAALGVIADGLTQLPAAPQDTAALVAADARSHAPRRTGRLASSITGRAGRNTAEIGTPVAYGWPVHQGVPRRGQRAQPFLRNALVAQQARILDAWAADIQRLIDKAV